jgi:hypothetical protein
MLLFITTNITRHLQNHKTIPGSQEVSGSNPLSSTIQHKINQRVNSALELTLFLFNIKSARYVLETARR